MSRYGMNCMTEQDNKISGYDRYGLQMYGIKDNQELLTRECSAMIVSTIPIVYRYHYSHITVSWFDHARDLMNLINQHQRDIPHPIVGIGHSMGGTQLWVTITDTGTLEESSNWRKGAISTLAPAAPGLVSTYWPDHPNTKPKHFSSRSFYKEAGCLAINRRCYYKIQEEQILPVLGSSCSWPLDWAWTSRYPNRASFKRRGFNFRSASYSHDFEAPRALQFRQTLIPSKRLGVIQRPRYRTE